MSASARLPPGSVVVAAHPDDETICAGALLARSPGCRVVHLTDGAPHERTLRTGPAAHDRTLYAAARAQELASALDRLGVAREDRYALGVPDQDAAAELVPIVLHLVQLWEALRPPVVVVHAYEGGHPDHDAASVAVRASLELLQRRSLAAPDALEMASYHGLPGTLVPLEFLPSERTSLSLRLTPQEVAAKCEAIACFSSQAGMLAQFPLDREVFRPASANDYARPPHAGTLLYERFGWCTGERWRRQVHAALSRLGLEEHAWLSVS